LSLHIRVSRNLALISSIRALAYYDKQDYERSIADYTAAIGLDPENPLTLYGRGLARQKRNDRNGGDADVAAAKALDPDVVAEFATVIVK